MKNLLVLLFAAVAIGTGSILLAIGLDRWADANTPRPPTTQHSRR